MKKIDSGALMAGGLLTVLVIMLLFSVYFVENERDRSLLRGDIDVVELRLPPLDLEKFTELEKAQKLVLE